MGDDLRSSTVDEYEAGSWMSMLMLDVDVSYYILKAGLRYKVGARH